MNTVSEFLHIKPEILQKIAVTLIIIVVLSITSIITVLGFTSIIDVCYGVRATAWSLVIITVCGGA